MPLLDQVSSEHFTAAIWQGGGKLFKGAAVQTLKATDNSVSCIVIGSRGDKYRVAISMSRMRIQYQCSCP